MKSIIYILLWINVYFVCIYCKERKWCEYGTVLRGGDECLCLRDGEDSCIGSDCGAGYGTSFYPKSCKDCRCIEEKRSKTKQPPKETSTDSTEKELREYMQWRDALAKGKTAKENNKKMIVAGASACVGTLLVIVFCLVKGT